MWTDSIKKAAYPSVCPKHRALVTAREKETPPMLKVVDETVVWEEEIGTQTLDDIARQGARP